MRSRGIVCAAVLLAVLSSTVLADEDASFFSFVMSDVRPAGTDRLAQSPGKHADNADERPVPPEPKGYLAPEEFEQLPMQLIEQDAVPAELAERAGDAGASEAAAASNATPHQPAMDAGQQVPPATQGKSPPANSSQNCNAERCRTKSAIGSDNHWPSSPLDCVGIVDETQGRQAGGSCGCSAQPRYGAPCTQSRCMGQQRHGRITCCTKPSCTQ